MDLVIKFTEHSNNVNNYGKLHANLRVPFTQYSTLIIDSLTTTCSFEVLNKEDYITFNETKQGAQKETKIQIMDSYSSLNPETISNILNDLLNVAQSGIRCGVDNTNRIVFQNQSSFSIVEASYRMKDILGIFDQQLPINANMIEESTYQIQCLSVGNYLSTAILYLIGSIGDKCYINNDLGRTNKKILMRINNSYSANFPIIANNAEFSVYALSNDFSDITFELVDARFNPIKLLSPLYLTGTISGNIQAESINLSPFVVPEPLEKNNSNEQN